MPSFRIQDTNFEAPLSVGQGSLTIKSSPRPYQIDFVSHRPLAETIEETIAAAKHPIIVADRRIIETHLAKSQIIKKTPALIATASEDFKTIEGSLELTALMQGSNVTRSSMLFAIGGGVIQDVAAFAGAIYKRGIPWTFIPTTLLAQGDSCLGGKAAINYHHTKNLLGLFSAPRRILIHTGFLATLAHEDLLSGLGEVFRLCVTGGGAFLEHFEKLLPAALKADTVALTRLIEASLAAKRAVVEFDEFELDLRRSMNLGHSIGHAFEAITHHGIPHGIGVTVGILVESEISHQRGLLSDAERQRLQRLAAPLIPPRIRALLAGLKLDDIVEVLQRDKKAEGSTLKLVVVEKIGQIRFIDMPLEAGTVGLLQKSVASVLAALAQQDKFAAA